jgi:phospholipase/carboxylesterase
MSDGGHQSGSGPGGQRLSGPAFGPAEGETPEQLVIMSHGLGADGNDLIGLAPVFARALPRAKFVSPNAPFPCDMAPMGYQWFSARDLSPPAVIAGVQTAAPFLDDFIDSQLAEAGLAEDKLALVGFSQGTMMSLYVGLRRDRPVAGIVGYSGRLIDAEDLPGEIKSRPPVRLFHGDQDPLIPVAAMAEAEAGLRAAGVEVESHVCQGLPHAINEEGIAGAMKFFVEIFGLRQS